jgi:flagellar FlgN protein
MLKAKLIMYLIYEKDILSHLLALAEKQQKTLIKSDRRMLESITKQQEEASVKMRKAEENRLNLLMNLFTISRGEARKMKLSEVAESFEGKEQEQVNELRLKLKEIMTKLAQLNMTNRVLANRARINIGEILGLFTNGKTNVCNVKV